MLTTIPFSGFYESLHDAALDDTLDGIFMNDECNINTESRDAAFDLIDWCAVRTGYAKEYAENFALEFNIPLVFESLQSPKYYNYTTDRIFCEINPVEVERLIESFDPVAWEEFVEARFTSCDGFISSYSNDLNDWGHVLSWDHNQVGTVLEFYAIQESANDFDQWVEFDIMEDSRCNGVIEELLYKNASEPLDSLVTF